VLQTILSILAATLTAQCSSQDREMPVVEVHEWGVLVSSGTEADLETHPGGLMDPVTEFVPDDPLVDRAPVVYFYGPPFTGRFTVEAVSGMILSTWPVPSAGSATWQISAEWAGLDIDPRAVSERVHPSIVDGWDATGWRIPQSMTIRTGEGFVDRFVYYECTVDPAVLPVQPRSLGVDVAEGFEDMPVALIIPSCAGPSVLPLSAGVLENPLELMRNSVVDQVDLLSLLYEWSRDVVDIEEVDALWGSWRRWFTLDGLPSPDSGEALLVYMVPAGVLDSVSTLELTTEQGYTVEYSRFILCVTRITLREV
jgi:hypothetical protein